MAAATVGMHCENKGTSLGLCSGFLYQTLSCFRPGNHKVHFLSCNLFSFSLNAQNLNGYIHTDTHTHTHALGIILKWASNTNRKWPCCWNSCLPSLFISPCPPTERTTVLHFILSIPLLFFVLLTPPAIRASLSNILFSFSRVWASSKGIILCALFWNFFFFLPNLFGDPFSHVSDTQFVLERNNLKIDW